MLSSSPCLKENVYAFFSMEPIFYQVAHSICDSDMETDITPCLSWGIITKLPLNIKIDQNTGKKMKDYALQL